MSLGLFAWVVTTVHAAPEAHVDEVVATGVDRCGPWPLFHKSSLWGCYYAVLKEGELATLQSLREGNVRSCLACAEGICRPKSSAVVTIEDRHARKICERLFLTPRDIGSLTKSRNSLSELQPLYVKFTYSISPDGRVTDIKISERDRRSRVSNRGALALIKDGARSVQFEPLVVKGERFRMIKVQDRYLLDGN